MNININDISNVPLIEIEPQKPRVEALVRENIELSRADWDAFETSWDFKKHPLL